MQYLPGRGLLPHQRYAAVISNRAIRLPLSNPGKSAVVSAFLPPELLHAMGIVPQFTEGLAGYLNGAGCEHAFVRFAEDRGIPQTYCSYHKVLLGAALSGVLPKPKLVVNTTLACDANNNTFRTLADFWKVPRFTLDVPDRSDPDAVAYVAAQFRELKGFLEEVTGGKLAEEALRAVIRRENRSIRLYRGYFGELSEKYIPNDMTSEMYKIFMTHVLAGTKEAERYFELLLEDARKAAGSGNEIRLLWVHTLPFWQGSMKSILNGGRIQLLCCDMNFDCMAEMDEAAPYEALSRKLLQNTFGGPGVRRTDALLQMAETLRADGVVYFCQWGCKQTLGNAYPAKERLEQAGIPTLILDGDGCDRGNVNDGQMTTRLQAFLEILEAKR
ncbi:MAG TPA: 2-hydroxyacyl-CoA dehydratase family protein [Feifaniaceae bacterium]|nr:2-hydroxyacyl-CoA dehydratase family protein [Feifaniaceae bacterium]